MSGTKKGLKYRKKRRNPDEVSEINVEIRAGELRVNLSFDWVYVTGISVKRNAKKCKKHNKAQCRNILMPACAGLVLCEICIAGPRVDRTPGATAVQPLGWGKGGAADRSQPQQTIGRGLTGCNAPRPQTTTQRLERTSFRFSHGASHPQSCAHPGHLDEPIRRRDARNGGCSPSFGRLMRHELQALFAFDRLQDSVEQRRFRMPSSTARLGLLRAPQASVALEHGLARFASSCPGLGCLEAAKLWLPSCPH